MSLDKMILEMNKRINLAESMTEQMERRIKELEEETNSLGIIEPGNSDPLIVHVTKITEFSTIQEFKPDDSSPSGLRATVELPGGAGNGRREWAIFKFPVKEKPPDIICMPGGAIFLDATIGDKPTVELSLELIQEDFDIDEVTWNDVQGFGLTKYNGSTFELDPDNDETQGGSAIFPGARLLFKNKLPDGNEDKFFTGFVMKEGSFSDNKNTGFTINYAVNFTPDTPNISAAFYIPNKTF